MFCARFQLGVAVGCGARGMFVLCSWVRSLYYHPAVKVCSRGRRMCFRVMTAVKQAEVRFRCSSL